MTKRYYITDPLQAAMAARDFEMKFVDSNGDELTYGDHYDGTSISATPKHGWASYCSWKIPHMYTDNKLYLHPDSEHLLEPQEGDLYKMPFPYSSFYIRTEVDKRMITEDGYNRGRIIERNGKPFPEIHSEEA